MSRENHQITEADLMPMKQYATERNDRRRAMSALKKDRRLAIGPDATLYFESYDTMWQQIHEMLHIEKGGAEQVRDELNAYNPLIPNGSELTATLMFEIDDEMRRAKVLGGLGGVEETVTIEFSGEVVNAIPEEDVDRTSAEGKASSVQFLHFPFSEEQIKKFRAADVRVTVGISHSGYGHMAVLSSANRNALSSDFN